MFLGHSSPTRLNQGFSNLKKSERKRRRRTRRLIDAHPSETPYSEPTTTNAGSADSIITTILPEENRPLRLYPVGSGQVALRLNERPRKTLGFQTPAIKLRASVASTL